MRKFHKILLFQLICFLVYAEVLPASWNLPATMISEMGVFSFEPSLSTELNSSNQAIAVWDESTGGAGQAAIVGANFDGSTWSAPVTISDPAQSSNVPQVALNTSNQALAVWQNNGTNVIIQASFFNGSSWSTPVNISAAGQNAQAPFVGISSTGVGIAIWQQTVGSFQIIQGATFNGATWSTPVNISAASQNASDPELAVNASGKAVAVWLQNTGSGSFIQSATFNGISWSSPTNISASGGGVQPFVAINSAGQAAAVWVDGDAFASNFNGTSWSSPATLSSNSAFGASVAINDANQAVAVFYEGEPSGAINVESSFFNGTSWGPEIFVDTGFIFANEGQTSVGLDSAGNAYADWLFSDPSGVYNICFASFFNQATQTWGTRTQLSPMGADTLQPVMAVNPAGNAIAAFVSVSSGVDAVFAVESFIESDLSTVVANPTHVAADGVSPSTITVTLFDNMSIPIVGHTVSLAALNGSSVISPPSGPSDSFGRVTFTVTDTVIETVSYQATDETTGTVIEQIAEVNFVTPEVTNSTVVASPTSVVANGTSFSTITVTLSDGGVPLAGHTVTLAAANGSSIITPTTGVTDNAGQFSFQVRDAVVEIVTYIATDLTTSVTILQTAQVNFTPVIPPPLPPSNFAGKRVRNRFATQTEFIDRLTWTPSPDTSVVAYYIFNGNSLVAIIPATGPFVIEVHNRNKDVTYTYTLFAVDGSGVTSIPVSINVP